jgi:polyisoprenoid-binding protein YceI
VTTPPGWRRAGILLAASLLLAEPTALRATEPVATPPGELAFVARNHVATADGVFRSWRIKASRVDPSDLESGFVEVEIDVASLDTDNARRDDHLRGPDFFDVVHWPTATARVDDVRPGDADERGRAHYDARFQLTIRDVTRTTRGSFVVASEAPLVVEGTVTIDRNEWGIGKPKRRFDPFAIDDEVPITFRVRLPVGSPPEGPQPPDDLP